MATGNTLNFHLKGDIELLTDLGAAAAAANTSPHQSTISGTGKYAEYTTQRRQRITRWQWEILFSSKRSRPGMWRSKR